MAVLAAVTDLTVVRKFQSFVLSWTPPTVGVPEDVITEYVVRFGQGDATPGGPLFPEKKALADAEGYTIIKDDLIASVTDYTFEVVVTNASGNSPATQATGTYTVLSVAPPENLTLIPMDKSLLVGWDDGENSDAAVSYTVQYGLNGSSDTPATRSCASQEVMLTGLTNYRKYDVSVLATSATESGDYSDTKTMAPTDNHHRPDEELTEINELTWTQDDVNLNVFRSTITDKDGYIGKAGGPIPPLKAMINAYGHNVCRWVLYDSSGDDEAGYVTKTIVRGQAKNAHQALAQIHNALLNIESEIKIEKATVYDVAAAKAVLMPGE